MLKLHAGKTLHDYVKTCRKKRNFDMTEVNIKHIIELTENQT
jgi:hypothetical protein